VFAAVLLPANHSVIYLIITLIVPVSFDVCFYKCMMFVFISADCILFDGKYLIVVWTTIKRC